MDTQTKNVKVTVFKQFSLKWQEVGKSAATAGIVAAVGLIYTSIDAGQFPTSVELLAAAKLGALTMIGAIIRYILNPTTTVIKGQDEPVVNVNSAGTVIATDTKK